MPESFHEQKERAIEKDFHFWQLCVNHIPLIYHYNYYTNSRNDREVPLVTVQPVAE